MEGNTNNANSTVLPQANTEENVSNGKFQATGNENSMTEKTATSEQELFHDVPRVETSDSEIFNDCIEKGVEISEEGFVAENLDADAEKVAEFSIESSGESKSGTEISSASTENSQPENNDEKKEEKVKPKRPPPPNTRLLQY